MMATATMKFNKKVYVLSKEKFESLSQRQDVKSEETVQNQESTCSDKIISSNAKESKSPEEPGCKLIDEPSVN